MDGGSTKMPTKQDHPASEIFFALQVLELYREMQFLNAVLISCLSALFFRIASSFQHIQCYIVNDIRANLFST